MLTWLPLLSLLFACTDDGDELVDQGLALKTEYQTAWCAAASDAACTSSACDFEAYPDVARCESAVNLAFADCPGIYEAMGERAVEVQSCVTQLSALGCEGDSVCIDGATAESAGDCAVIAELQTIYCRAYDTWR